MLADHFERAAEIPRAVHWLGVAAQQALDADDLVETLARVERGVNLGAAGEELCAMRVVESQARFWHGEYVEAERAAREALAPSGLSRDAAFARLAAVASHTLLSIDFAKEPLYLPEAEAMSARDGLYRAALHRLDNLREMRARLAGRAIHSSAAAWRAQLEKLRR